MSVLSCIYRKREGNEDCIEIPWVRMGGRCDDIPLRIYCLSLSLSHILLFCLCFFMYIYVPGPGYGVGGRLPTLTTEPYDHLPPPLL